MPTVTLSPASETGLDVVERLLRECDLPTEGVRDGPGEFFLAASDGLVVGCGGLEVYGDVALLRSVAVDPAHRGEGCGMALVRGLLGQATERGVDAVYLLTTTAADFFERLGFERLDRADAPAAVRESREFAETCPASATCMRWRQ